MAIAIAVEEFVSDYKTLPIPPVPGPDRNVDSSAATGLITALKGLDSHLNPRAVDYIGDFKDARRTDDGYFDGIVRNAGSVGLVDPWGSAYVILLDADSNGFILSPESTDPPSPIHRRALVYSAGKDGDPSTWSDNVTSWSQ